MSLRIKKGDLVVVVAGHEKLKGQQGRVLRVVDDGKKYVVEGLNKVKRNLKPTPRSAGGVIEKEMPLAAARIALVDPTTGKATRFKTNTKDGKKVRVSTKSGAELV